MKSSMPEPARDRAPPTPQASDLRDELLRLKRDYLVPCVHHFYRDPPAIVAARDCLLIDAQGREYLDFFSGVTVVNAGHCNPHIRAAAVEQLARLDHTTTIYLTQPMLRLAERLASILPAGLRRSFFCVSGSEANEMALLAATRHTGRSQVLALSGALHGRTRWAMSATGLEMWRIDPSPLADVHHVPRAYDLDALTDALARIGPERVAAVIGEPIQGNGGIVVPPDDFWPAVRELCDRYRIVLILDEVQTGMNRTGRWWACEHWGVCPDVLTTAKALANGLPLAATVMTDAVAESLRRPAASTFGGNPVCCAAALATIDFHEQERLAARATEAGNLLRTLLTDIARTRPQLASVRGRGLMVGADIVTPSGQPDAAGLDDLLERLKERGMLCGKTGRERNVLTLMPPLTVTRRHLEALAKALEESLEP